MPPFRIRQIGFISFCVLLSHRHANQSLHIMEEDKKRRLGTATTEVKSPTQTEVLPYFLLRPVLFFVQVESSQNSITAELYNVME